MSEEVCADCVHFRQHYILDEQSCMTVNCGHCVHSRLKGREPTHRACKAFELRAQPPSIPNRNHVIRFLTTQVLEYILSLDLPPEIKQG